MSKMRHWKQHFDMDAVLVFRKRMVVRGYGVDVAQPGDIVPDAMKTKFGKHRMKIWWEAGFFEIQGPEALDKALEGLPVESTPIATLGDTKMAEPKPVVIHLGGGWYDVTRDGVTTRIKGKGNIPS